MPSRRCSGKSSKDSLFSSFSSASACTRVSTSFSASSSATLWPKHCWQRPVLESAKLETSNNSEHAGTLCYRVSWQKRDGKGPKRCYREKYEVTRGKYKLTPFVFGKDVGVSMYLLRPRCLQKKCVWACLRGWTISTPRGRILGSWGWYVFSLSDWLGAVQGALGLILTFASLFFRPTNAGVWEGNPGGLTDTERVIHLLHKAMKE